MPIGPGVYDDLATHCREQAEGEGVVLLILGGKHGGGFSVQCPAERYPDLIAILRHVATSIESDIRRLTAGKPTSH